MSSLTLGIYGKKEKLSSSKNGKIEKSFLSLKNNNFIDYFGILGDIKHFLVSYNINHINKNDIKKLPNYL